MQPKSNKAWQSAKTGIVSGITAFFVVNMALSFVLAAVGVPFLTNIASGLGILAGSIYGIRAGKQRFTAVSNKEKQQNDLDKQLEEKRAEFSELGAAINQFRRDHAKQLGLLHTLPPVDAAPQPSKSPINLNPSPRKQNNRFKDSRWQRAFKSFIANYSSGATLSTLFILLGTMLLTSIGAGFVLSGGTILIAALVTASAFSISAAIKKWRAVNTDVKLHEKQQKQLTILKNANISLLDEIKQIKTALRLPLNSQPAALQQTGLEANNELTAKEALNIDLPTTQPSLGAAIKEEIERINQKYNSDKEAKGSVFFKKRVKRVTKIASSVLTLINERHGKFIWWSSMGAVGGATFTKFTLTAVITFALGIVGLTPPGWIIFALLPAIILVGVVSGYVIANSKQRRLQIEQANSNETHKTLVELNSALESANEELKSLIQLVTQKPLASTADEEAGFDANSPKITEQKNQATDSKEYPLEPDKQPTVTIQPAPPSEKSLVSTLPAAKDNLINKLSPKKKSTAEAISKTDSKINLTVLNEPHKTQTPPIAKEPTKPKSVAELKSLFENAAKLPMHKPPVQTKKSPNFSKHAPELDKPQKVQIPPTAEEPVQINSSVLKRIKFYESLQASPKGKQVLAPTTTKPKVEQALLMERYGIYSKKPLKPLAADIAAKVSPADDQKPPTPVTAPVA